ncbi:FCD domain-containing protein [Ferrovibrio sp.]|uniref:FCD domain-containing protein n=1 Tax=Ferrovibrio sp. TaxID=1917215 RepID=UPI0035B4F12C
MAELWGPSNRHKGEEGAKTLADEAYLLIREDVIRGVFAPLEKLQPDALRKRYDIGLSPVREALSRLALEGLAKAEGQRGFFVSPVSKGELLDIADLRIQFSVMAVQRAMQLGDDQWENGIVTSYYQLNKMEKLVESEPEKYKEEWERRNRQFHASLEIGCGSPWLLHFCDMLYDLIERYRRLFVSYSRIERDSFSEHQEIMELVLARDPRACEVLAEHFRHASKVIATQMDKLAITSVSGKKPAKLKLPAASVTDLRKTVRRKPARGRAA